MTKSFKLTVPSERHKCRPGRPITLPGTPGARGEPGADSVNLILAAQCDRTVTIGQPLYTKPSGTLDLAIANALATSRLCGLAKSNAPAFASVNYELDGIIQQINWTNVTGTASLSPGQIYYLSPTTAGKLTTIAPTTSYQLVCKVGIAISPSTLNLEIELPILL